MFTSNNEWFVTKKLITGAISDWHAGSKRSCDGGYESPSAPAMVAVVTLVRFLRPAAEIELWRFWMAEKNAEANGSAGFSSFPTAIHLNLTLVYLITLFSTHASALSWLEARFGMSMSGTPRTSSMMEPPPAWRVAGSGS